MMSTTSISEEAIRELQKVFNKYDYFLNYDYEEMKEMLTKFVLEINENNPGEEIFSNYELLDKPLMETPAYGIQEMTEEGKKVYATL